MIDIDQLDERLEQALSDEVRMLRGITTRPGSPLTTSRFTPPPPRPSEPEPEPLHVSDLDWPDEVEPARRPDDSWMPPPTVDDVAPGEPPRPTPAPRTAAAPRAATAAAAPAAAARRRDEAGPPRPATRVPAAPTNGKAARRIPPAPVRAPAKNGDGLGFEFELKAEPDKTPVRATPVPRDEPANRAERPSRFRTPTPPAGSALYRLRQAAAALSGPDGGLRDLELSDHARLIPELLASGDLALLDQRIATHADVTAKKGTTKDRADAAAWETMRALLDGRRDDARDGVTTVRRMVERAGATGDAEQAWTLRFWVGLEWGEADEQSEILDHCRERAYRHNDLTWRGALTLQLARLGRTDEACREFDAVAADVQTLPLDVLTDLAEAAFLLRDARRAAPLEEPLAAQTVQLVGVGPAWVCKGSLARFHAHVAAPKGSWKVADQYFGAALKVHRRLGAEPLVARTLHEWGTSLRGRDDDLAARYLDEAAELAARLRLAGIAVGAAAH